MSIFCPNDNLVSSAPLVNMFRLTTTVLATIIFSLASTNAANQDTYALVFQVEGYLNPSVYDDWALLLDPELPQLNKLTICAWFQILYMRASNTMWSYCNDIPVPGSSQTKFLCAMLMFEDVLIVEISGTSAEINKVPKAGWNLVCATHEAFPNSTASLTVWLNGVKEYCGTQESTKIVNYWPAGGTWILGQDQDNLGGSFEIEESFSGMISYINIWSYHLTETKISEMSTCKDAPLGDVFDWSQSNWNLSRVTSLDLSTADFCNDIPTKNYIMFPEKVSLDSAEALCKSMGGSVAMPLNDTETLTVADYGDAYHEICGANKQSGKTLWLGMRRDADWNWSNMKTNSPITYSNFKSGDGGGLNNCAYLITRFPGRHGKWGSAVESPQSPRELCTVCEFYSQFAVLSLRGLCKASRQDRQYYVQRNGLEKPYFKGPSSSRIKWNDTLKAWHLDQLQFYAEALYHGDGYPTGRKKWRVSDPMCNLDNEEVMLTFTSCQETEFTCDDGSCIPLQSRCNLDEDCIDGSDEKDCVRVVFSEGYEKGLSPKLWENGTKVDAPLPVYFGVELISFDQINTIDMMIGVILEVNITWRDSRLKFQNLREDAFLNLISEEDENNIFIPRIGFSNSKTGRVDPDGTRILSIRKDSDPNDFDVSKASEDYVYEGSENSLVFMQRFYAEYQCTFNLRMFPFDDQICKMEFNSVSVTKQNLVLIPGDVEYVGPTVLVEFVITDINMGRGDHLNESRSEIRVVVHMGRQYVYHLSQSFFQSFLLGLLAYLTFWIDLEDFSDRFMGGLTSLLVLASLMSSLSDSLPKTSYFKVIDYWLLFFLLATSCMTAVHILIFVYYKKEQESAIFKSAQSLKQTEKMELSHINSTSNMKAEVKHKLSRVHQFFRKKSSNWTAQGINQFQKIFFPSAFFIFVFIFILITYFKAGYIEPTDMEIN